LDVSPWDAPGRLRVAAHDDVLLTNHYVDLADAMFKLNAEGAKDAKTRKEETVVFK
jgi:hypothetical protein